MPKKSKPTAVAASAPTATAERKYVKRPSKHGKPGMCRYCTAKLPRGRSFCNDNHKSLYSG